jgi:outer membrane lipoprotein-sorting protein
MNKNNLFILALVVSAGVLSSCQPKTPAEKVQDKVEDASHEAGQAVERAGERVKDATN